MDIVYHHNVLPKELILTAPDGSQITINKPSEIYLFLKKREYKNHIFTNITWNYNQPI